MVLTVGDVILLLVGVLYFMCCRVMSCLGFICSVLLIK